MGDLAIHAKANTIYCLHLKKTTFLDFLKRTLSHGSYEVKPDHQSSWFLREDNAALHQNWLNGAILLY